MSADELVALAVAKVADLELSGMIFEEAHRRRRRVFDRVTTALFPGRKLEPVPWLDLVRRTAQHFSRADAGGHHLYVVLLDGYRDGGRYRPYVGETRYLPGRRFSHHLANRHASSHVRRNGIVLLPSLYEHLNPLGRADAKRLERELAEAFESAGIRTEGGH